MPRHALTRVALAVALVHTASGAVALRARAPSVFAHASRAAAPLRRAPIAGARAHAQSSLLTPAETFKLMEEEGAKRSLEPFEKLVWKGLAAGMLIGTGGILCSGVGGDMGLSGEHFWEPGMGVQRLIFGAFGYPLSIICVAATGSSAFTGNLAFAGAALRSGRATPGGAFQMAAATLLGCIIGACLMGVLTHVCELPAAIPTIAIAQHKAHLTVAQTIGRGIGGGWLIALAITLATAATKGGGNFADLALAVWFPISTYVICDFEHGLANFFFFTAAILSGGEFETADVVKNLVCSTAGNVIGAGARERMRRRARVSPGARPRGRRAGRAAEAQAEPTARSVLSRIALTHPPCLPRPSDSTALPAAPRFRLCRRRLPAVGERADRDQLACGAAQRVLASGLAERADGG
jgi:formate/nitrite transporter FocA (FNT family)